MKIISVKGELFLLTEEEFYELLLSPQTFVKENFEIDIPDYISIQPMKEETILEYLLHYHF